MCHNPFHNVLDPSWAYYAKERKFILCNLVFYASSTKSTSREEVGLIEGIRSHINTIKAVQFDLFEHPSKQEV